MRSSKSFVIIGITGSIASGKSHFCKEISKLNNVKVFSSDEMVHALYKDKNFLKKLAAEFGDIIENGSVNRQKLGEIVFNNIHKKKQLEAIIYPLLAERRQNLIKLLTRQHFRGFLLFEIPLLFENNLQNECDFIITVFSNQQLQKSRVLKRAGMSGEKFQKILKTQYPLIKKKNKSDFLYNSGDDNFSAIRVFRGWFRH